MATNDGLAGTGLLTAALGRDAREALGYERLPDNRVRCNLCAHHCLILEGKAGICHVRVNRGGALYSLVYGRAISANIDPVEKKPLLHFYPGSTAYSIATPGCNFHCRWCQNWDISQMPREMHLVMGAEASPEQIVEEAQRSGCRSIAYTYTEPTVFFEYAYDTARIAHERGLANIFVTNGYESREALEMLGPYLDAANVDLKAFRDSTYRKYVGAMLGPVLDTVRWLKGHGVWLEVTTLVIPGLNDDPAELADAAGFVAGELGADTPWHISRFSPGYRMLDVPPTPAATLQRAAEIGRKAGLRYVYVGNVAGEENTRCHRCGKLLIRRGGYRIVKRNVRVKDGGFVCPDCGEAVAGVGLGGGQTESPDEPFGPSELL
ncbi:MAG TPA: AmmeMemoRadiSam system radical SAM enzyme [Chloroflexia bacterium]|nr:AmmeMemoRadiSam system radical SAM enzyme [Chloroflexia bacterium]